MLSTIIRDTNSLMLKLDERAKYRKQTKPVSAAFIVKILSPGWNIFGLMRKSPWGAAVALDERGRVLSSQNEHPSPLRNYRRGEYL